MAQELVWARVGDHCAAVSRSQAIGDDLEVLDEPVRDGNGDVRRPTRANGRPRKKRTSVAQEAAAQDAAPSEATEPPDTAPTDDTEENQL